MLNKWDKSEIFRGAIDGNIRYSGDNVMSGPTQTWDERRMLVIAEERPRAGELCYDSISNTTKIVDSVRTHHFKIVSASFLMKGVKLLTAANLRKLRWLNRLVMNNKDDMMELTPVQSSQI